MKRLLSVILVLSMLLSALILASCGNNEEDPETTEPATTAATTTVKREDPPKSDDDDDDDDDSDVTLVGLPENGDLIPWKYHVEAVDYLTEGGVTDYIRMGDGGDGFEAFIASNPKWNALDYDDSEWGVHDEVGQLDANVGYDGINHGLFVRANFELTQDQYDKIKNGEAGVYLYAKYDNTFHVYVNGIQIYADDGSWQFQEGVNGSSIPGFISDWFDTSYKVIPVQYDASYEDGEEIQGSLTPADILQVGNNVVACSLKDAWGGRLFDADLYYTTVIDW